MQNKSDMKNKNIIYEIDWWEHEDNKTTFQFPISLIYENGNWIATFNLNSKKYIGEILSGVCSGKTKEEAISNLFKNIQILHEYSEKCRLSYKRFVPLILGNWKSAGGRWVDIFGINIYFRYGKGMKGGIYIPFTKLNIQISNGWKIYKEFKINNYNLLKK